MAAKKKAAKQKPAPRQAAKKPAAKRPAAKRAVAKAPAKAKVIERRKQPESMRLRSVMIGLTVNDLQRSIAWYRDILGFVVTDEWKDKGVLMGVGMRAGAAEIWLGQDDWKKGRDRVKGEGIRIYGRTVQDVDRVAALIKGRGGVLAHEPKTEPWGERDFGLVDPDGFKITVSHGA